MQNHRFAVGPIGRLAGCLLAAWMGWTAGCEPCLDSGKNGVPDPGPDEYQLVFDNQISRNTTVSVDGEKVGVACEETNNVTLGNFPVSHCSTIMAFSRVSWKECYFSPNCTGTCDDQVCGPDACIDTVPYAGQVLEVRLIWKY